MDSVRWALFRRTNVAIGDLRHDDRPAYIEDGFGGRPLGHWPVFRFFQLYKSLDESEAEEAFVAWYADQFMRHGQRPKSEGGMRDGSLYRMVVDEHVRRGQPVDLSAGVFDSDTLQHAIRCRVRQRLSFFESVIRDGFVISKEDPIRGVRENGAITIRSGHHRVAALLAIGEEFVPAMMVYPGWIAERTDRALRRAGQPSARMLVRERLSR